MIIMNNGIDIKVCTECMLSDLQCLCRTTFAETFSDSNGEKDMQKFLDSPIQRKNLSAELANSESVTYIA